MIWKLMWISAPKLAVCNKLENVENHQCKHRNYCFQQRLEGRLKTSVPAAQHKLVQLQEKL